LPDERLDCRLGNRKDVGFVLVRRRDGERDVAGVAEVPGETVEVATDVAARAGLIAERRRVGRRVEEPTPDGNVRRLRIEERDVRRLLPGRARSTTEMESSKRVDTNATPASSSRTIPAGPPPVTAI